MSRELVDIALLLESVEKVRRDHEHFEPIIVQRRNVLNDARSEVPSEHNNFVKATHQGVSLLLSAAQCRCSRQARWAICQDKNLAPGNLPEVASFVLLFGQRYSAVEVDDDLCYIADAEFAPERRARLFDVVITYRLV